MDLNKVSFWRWVLYLLPIFLGIGVIAGEMMLHFAK